MEHVRKRIGWGSLSLVLVFIGFFWSFSFGFNGFCFGDTVLTTIGLEAWKSGFHLAILYSIIFFAPALFLGIKYKDDFGAKAGRVTTLFIVAVLLLYLLLAA